jgi:hypothetical protein
VNLTAMLKGSAEHGGPIALSASVAAFTVALVGSGHGESLVGARPGPTVTVTAPAPNAGRTAAVARPSVTPTPTSASVVAVSDRMAALPHSRGGGLSHTQGRPPSISEPAPTSSAAVPCGGTVFAVRALRAACVSIGR